MRDSSSISLYMPQRELVWQFAGKCAVAMNPLRVLKVLRVSQESHVKQEFYSARRAAAKRQKEVPATEYPGVPRRCRLSAVLLRYQRNFFTMHEAATETASK